MKVDFLTHQSASHVRVLKVVLITVDPARSDGLPGNIINMDELPHMVAEIEEFVMHSSPYMTHRQELLSVFIFVRVTKDEISGAHTIIGVIQLNGELLRGGIKVFGFVRSRHANVMNIVEKANRSHCREELR